MKTKKVTTQRELSLNKETITNLDFAKMAQIVGGTGDTAGISDPDGNCVNKKPSNACQNG